MMGSDARSVAPPLEFLRALYGDEAPGYLALPTFEPTDVYWHKADDLAGLAAAALARDTANCYFNVGLQPVPLNGGKRGKAATVIGIPGAYLELDWAHAVHKKTHLPPEREAALALLGEFALPPSIILDSGHGLHVWWLLPELWTWAPGDDKQRQDAHALVVAVQSAVQRLAKAHGWTDVDSTHDLARVLRLPGTHNYKDSPPTPVTILDWHPERRYRRAELHAAAETVPALLGSTPRHGGDAGQPTEPAAITPDERERLTEGLITASWPYPAADGTPTPSRHQYLLDLAGYLTGVLAVERVEAVLVRATEKANDRDFLDKREWRGEIHRAVTDTARKRQADEPFRGWYKLAETFGGLAMLLSALWTPAGTTGAIPAPGFHGQGQCVPAACLEAERATAAALRLELAAATQEVHELKRQQPAQYAERMARAIVTLESDPTTRGNVAVLTEILAERTRHGDARIPWCNKTRAQQLGWNKNVNRMGALVHRARDAGLVTLHERPRGTRAQGDFRTEQSLDVAADMPTDLADALLHCHQRLKAPKVPRKLAERKAQAPCACNADRCACHPDAPLIPVVARYCNECHAEVTAPHAHVARQAAQRRVLPAVAFRRVPPVSTPDFREYTNLTTYTPDFREYSAGSPPAAPPREYPDPAGEQRISDVLASLDALDQDPEYQKLSAAAATARRLEVLARAQQEVA
ncbi:MAG TPA: hypothetical protein VII06_43195 [Chloroflexota bacterium]|jgi:hypothetical protein